MTTFTDGKRNRLAPLTPVRAYRLERGLVLYAVAARAGLTTFRASIIERDPSQARPGELEAHRHAVDELAAEMKGAA